MDPKQQENTENENFSRTNGNCFLNLLFYGRSPNPSNPFSQFLKCRRWIVSIKNWSFPIKSKTYLFCSGIMGKF
jgi:hypothetical protein